MPRNISRFLFFSLFAAVLFSGCAEEKPEPIIDDDVEKTLPTVTLSKKEMAVPAEGMSATVSVAIIDAEGWEVEVTATGCVASASLSDDWSSITFVVPENEDAVEKSGTVSIDLVKDDDVVYDEISVTQAAAEKTGGDDNPEEGGDDDPEEGGDDDPEEGGETEGVWTLVTDASSLKSGDVLVIACNTKGKLAGDFGSESVLDPVDCTFSGDKSEISELPEDALVLTLGGSAGSWTFSNSGKKLGVTAVKKLAWDDGTTTWTIAISQNNSTITSTTSSFGRLQYNASAPRFTTYTSGQQPVQLYRGGEGDGGESGGETGGDDDEPSETPYVTTAASATSISSASAKVSATFFSGSSAPEKLFFAYGTDESYFYGEKEASASSATSGSFSAEITGLKASTKYYYKALMSVGGKEYEGKVYSFTTSSAYSGSSDYTTKGWFELPSINDDDRNGVDDGDANIYYAYHTFTYGGSERRNYTVCYSGKHHCPLWVAAPRHSFYAQKGTSRSDAYKQDPDIPSSVQYSSKDTGGGCNKGHMLGSAERLVSADANRQVFYYTNIAPQLSSGFNTGGGGWNILEDYMDTMIPTDTLYEVVGCYFDEYTDGYGYTVSPKTISFGGRSDVSFPTMFYYAVIRSKSGKCGKALKDCSASELQCVAFVRSHTNSLKGQKPSSAELMSISDLEKITGFKYFVNIPNAPKDTFSASDWDL